MGARNFGAGRRRGAPGARWSGRAGRGPRLTRLKTKRRWGLSWLLWWRLLVARVPPSCRWPASIGACALCVAAAWAWGSCHPRSCACSRCALARAGPLGVPTAVGSGPSWRPTPSTTATATRSSSCAGAGSGGAGVGREEGGARPRVFGVSDTFSAYNSYARYALYTVPTRQMMYLGSEAGSLA